MSVLKKLEEKIQTLFEGGFGKAFKSPVQPVELARKLVREMAENKVVSISHVFVPNEYTIFLSPADREQFESYEEHLKSDLSAYVMEHARKDDCGLLTRPVIIIETDEDLNVGEFGIATRMVSGPEAIPEAPPQQPQVGQTVIYRPPATAAPARALLETGGHRYEIGAEPAVIGRSRQCNIVLADPNVSRRHAQLSQQGADYVIFDLDSTNGVEVNGAAIRSQVLADGDLIGMGTTTLTFRRIS